MIDQHVRDASAGTLLRICIDRKHASWQTTEVILEFLHSHVFDQGLTVREILSSLPLAGSRSLIRLRFQDDTRESIKSYITDCRLKTALNLLIGSDLSMMTISSLVGYQNYNTFLRAFKKWHGASPRTIVRIDALSGVDKPVLSADFSAFMKKLAESVWKEIRRCPRDQWPLLLQEVRFQSRELFDCLCEKSLEEGRSDRQIGIDIMQLAIRSLELSSSWMSMSSSGLFALGLARLGNARRLALDYDGAERDFELAETYLTVVRGESDIVAEVLWLKGALRLHQRRFNEALSCLQEGIGLSRVAERYDLEMRCIVLRSKLYAHWGRSTDAVGSLIRARDGVDQLKDCRLKAAFYSTLANGYVWSGDYTNALDAVERAEFYLDGVGDLLGEMQLKWLRGIALYERGDTSAAARILDETYAGFIDLGEQDHAAVVALELAAIRLHEGMIGESVGFASESLRVFSRLKVVPEALAAERLLSEAISRRDLTLREIGEAKKCLRKILLHGLGP